MPTMKTHPYTSRKTRRGGVGIGTHAVIALAFLMVARAGGPGGIAHDVVQLADYSLEVAHFIAGLIATGAVTALVIRIVRICWRERNVHVITDAAWPRGTRMEGGR